MKEFYKKEVVIGLFGSLVLQLTNFTQELRKNREEYGN